MGLPCVSVLEPVLTVFQSYLGTPAGRRVGAQHVLDAEYFRRIDALNFTMEHDDGQLPDDIEEADIVLIGISRTSKTPTSIYLANRGIKTANIPIVLGVPVPDKPGRGDASPLIVGLIATAERISHVRQNRMLGTTAGYDAQGYVDRADDRRGAGLCPPDLHPPWLADDRCQPPLDRGDGGGDRCAARQGALGGCHSSLRAPSHARTDHPCLEQPVPQGDADNAGIAFDARASLRSTSARSKRRSRDSGATPEDVALVLAEAKALDVSERKSRRAGARLRPDAVAGRRGVPQAGGHGSGAPASARAVRARRIS